LPTGEYEQLFDHADARHFNDRVARVVFIMARSVPNLSKRNSYRLRKFPGPFKDTREFSG
jgi:hypothetical protein